MKKIRNVSLRVLSAALLSVFLLFSFSAPVLAAQEPEDPTLPSGLTYAELATAIEEHMEKNQTTTAAASIAVFTNTETIYEKDFGFVNAETQLANTEDAVFEWGSCTKLLTWTCLMQLAEAGKVNLTDDIRTYLPQDFFKRLRYSEPITILNLMNHDAGWQETMTDLFVADIGKIKGLEDTLRMTEPDQINKPGSIVSYSNWGTGVAGLIIERVSGQTYQAYVKEHIFVPLGMTHTAVAADLSDNAWVREKRMLENAYTPDNQSLGTCFYYIPLAPAGMATGTMDDFILFAKAFLVSEGDTCPLFEDRATLDQMISPSLMFSGDTMPRNCHGFWTDSLAVPVIWHNGGTMGFSSWFTFDPVSKTAMIVLVNQTEESAITYGVLTAVYGTSSPEPGIPSDDPSGLFMSARNVFSGFAKFTHLFSYEEIEKKADGEYGATEGTLTLSGTTQDYYIVNKEAPKSYPAFVTEDENGNTIIQIAATDFIEQNQAVYIAENVLLILFAISIIFAVISLLVSLVRMAMRKKGIGTAGRLRAIINLVILAAAACIGYIIMIILENSALWVDIQPVLIVLAILAILPVIFGIYLLATRNVHKTIGRFQKIWLIAALVNSLFMTINLMYLDFIRFW